MLKYKLKCQKAFTLIEMAVVLVIIGIVLTTVIKGGEVLRASRIKGMIQTQNDLQQAAMLYREKFGNKAITMGNLQAADLVKGTTDPMVENNFGVKVTFSNYSFSTPRGKISIQAVKYSDMPFDVAQAMKISIDGPGAVDACAGSMQSIFTMDAGLPICDSYLNYSNAANKFTVYVALYPVAP